MIIQKLLLLETEAKEAMRTIEREQVSFFKKSTADLHSTTQSLEADREATLASIAAAIEVQTSATIEKIQAEYYKKEGELTQNFANHHSIWQEDILHRVLFEDGFHHYD